MDHRADIYALGVVFYQMLTGELPGKRLEAPSKKVQMDVRLDEVVLRALDQNPDLRYQQVSEVKMCVDTIVATPPISSQRKETPAEAAEPRQAWWTWWGFQSPEVGQICAHLTKAERKHLLVLMLLSSVWGMVSIFGIPALNGPMRHIGSGGWIVTVVWAGLYILSLPMIDRMMRHFFCSTDWARKQGITSAKLRLFSFRSAASGARVPALLVLVVLLSTLLMVEILGGLSGTIFANKAVLPNQVEKRHSDKAAPTAQNPSAPTVHVVHANTNTAGFGPMTECTVNFSEPEQDMFLSFETGNLMKEPGGRLKTPEPERLHVADEVLTWAGSSGADLLLRFCIGKSSPNSPFAVPQLLLRSLDLAMFPTNTEAWDGLSSEAIATAVRSWPEHGWWQDLFWGAPSEYTFLFRTRQGNAGILLVTSFNDKPRSVKLFYKLVLPQADGVKQLSPH